MTETSESVVKTFFSNTTFHGFRFIVEKRRHWMERVFWTICCILSWIATGLLFYSSWKDFQNNAISFVVETSYLDWNTNFPSVVVCETDNQESIARTTDKTFGDPHDYNLDEIVKELVFYRGISFYTLQICGTDVPNRTENCFLRNFNYFSEEVKSSCKEIFQICKWHGREFDCCTYFREIDSEFGKCYAINSIQTRNISPPVYQMISNRLTGAGTLYLELKGITNLYTFGEQEVPSLTSLANDVMQITPHIRYQRYLAIKEIDNQQEVRDVSIEQRKCRFPEESKSIDVHRYYSYSACCVQCRKEAQLRKCGCVHHLMPNTTAEQHCGFDGLQCLNINYNQIAVLKASWANRTGLVCGCLPSCTEIELSIIRDDKTGIGQEYAIVELTLEKLPTERFKRNVVRGKLDLVVSMGGAIALFLGASILSFVEVIYYFFVRPLSDLTRKKWKKQKKRTELDGVRLFGNNLLLPRVS